MWGLKWVWDATVTQNTLTNLWLQDKLISALLVWKDTLISWTLWNLKIITMNLLYGNINIFSGSSSAKRQLSKLWGIRYCFERNPVVSFVVWWQLVSLCVKQVRSFTHAKMVNQVDCILLMRLQCYYINTLYENQF